MQPIRHGGLTLTADGGGILVEDDRGAIVAELETADLEALTRLLLRARATLASAELQEQIDAIDAALAL